MYEQPNFRHLGINTSSAENAFNSILWEKFNELHNF